MHLPCVAVSTQLMHAARNLGVRRCHFDYHSITDSKADLTVWLDLTLMWNLLIIDTLGTSILSEVVPSSEVYRNV